MSLPTLTFRTVTPEPCPVCEGKCCRTFYLYRTVHMGAEYYTHDCEACVDGTKPLARPLTNDDLARAYDMGRDMERADTVAFLRERVTDTVRSEDDLDYALAVIERGAHRKASRPARPRIDPLALPCPACAAPVREPCRDMPPDAYCYARVEEADGGGVPINPETSK